MIDFVVREISAVTKGEMVIVRFGTCGLIDPKMKIGSIVVASEGSILCRRNEEAWMSEKSQPYTISSKAVPSDPQISALLKTKIGEAIGEGHVFEGIIELFVVFGIMMF